METKIKWNEGEGYITATYEGSGSGSASISSDVNEGIDREQSIKVETTDKSVSATLMVSQEGLREVFEPSDGDFVLANGGTFNVLKPVDLSKYLCIEALEDGLTVKLSTNSCEYKVDNGAWKELAASTETEAVNTGQILAFRGKLKPTADAGIGTFTLSKKCKVSGNCMSMLFGDDAKEKKSLSGYNYAFYRLFYNAYTLIEVSEDFLPATTISTYCYRDMFRNCTNLLSAPNLPSTSVTEACYSYMFYNCRNLKKAPNELPSLVLKHSSYNNMFYSCRALVNAPKILATTLATQCCRNMFNSCVSMIEAPELLSKTLVSLCYGNMFTNCSKLEYIKAMFTTTPSSTYTSKWVSGVKSTGTFVKSKDATWSVTGVHGIPSEWTVINE